MVVADSCTVNQVLPVGVGCTQCAISLTVFAIQSFNVCTELVSAKNINRVLLLADGYATRVRNGRLLTLATLLGCNDDDTVRTTGTVDSSCRSILQDTERLNILWVYYRKEVRKTLYTIVVHCQTIDNDQWVVRSVQGRTTTNTDLGTTTRSTVVAGNVYTGNLTCKHILCVDNHTLVLRVRLDRSNRTCQVVLFCYTITDDYDFVQRLRVILQGDVHVVGSLHCLWSQSQIGESKIRTWSCVDREVTIHVSNADSLTVHCNGSTHDRLTGSILHMSLNRISLRKGTHRQKQTTCEGQCSERQFKFYLLHHFV